MLSLHSQYFFPACQGCSTRYCTPILNMHSIYLQLPQIRGVVLWSHEGPFTPPMSPIITASVCTHWLLSLSEPVGCVCVAHNETGRSRALHSQWSADGSPAGISSLLLYRSVFLHTLSLPILLVQVAATLSGFCTRWHRKYVTLSA